jgi:sugar lactone lactonase YvrE
MHYVSRLLVALAICIGGLTASVTGVIAQEATPADGTPVGGEVTLPAGCTVVADGLINPRFVAIATDGTLYITEAGNGGDETLEAGPEGEAEEGGPPLTRGTGGQVTMVSPDGTQSVVADGLPSYSEGVGPTGIVLGDGVIWITTGGAAVAVGIEPLENENSVLQIDVATGEVTQVAELGSYEAENNPDGTDVNPNLYGMDLGADGQLYVNDAGGNTVYRVDPTTGEFTLLGIVPSSVPSGAEGAEATPEEEAPQVEDASPVADEEPQGPPQPVPTGLHVGADGNVYVVTLGAFAPGAAEVLIAQADGTFTQAAGGLTVGIGVALGPDGSVYVSQLASFAGEQPGPGNVVRIGADGAIETVVEGIPFAHGIAFDDAGNLYVVANSTAFGPPPAEPNGQVWRCDGVAPAA